MAAFMYVFITCRCLLSNLVFLQLVCGGCDVLSVILGRELCLHLVHPLLRLITLSVEDHRLQTPDITIHRTQRPASISYTEPHLVRLLVGCQLPSWPPSNLSLDPRPTPPLTPAPPLPWPLPHPFFGPAPGTSPVAGCSSVDTPPPAASSCRLDPLPTPPLTPAPPLPWPLTWYVSCSLMLFCWQASTSRLQLPSSFCSFSPMSTVAKCFISIRSCPSCSSGQSQWDSRTEPLRRQDRAIEPAGQSHWVSRMEPLSQQAGTQLVCEQDTLVWCMMSTWTSEPIVLFAMRFLCQFVSILYNILNILVISCYAVEWQKFNQTQIQPSTFIAFSDCWIWLPENLIRPMSMYNNLFGCGDGYY